MKSPIITGVECRYAMLTESAELCHVDKKLISCSFGSLYIHLWLWSAATFPIKLPIFLFFLEKKREREREKCQLAWNIYVLSWIEITYKKTATRFKIDQSFSFSPFSIVVDFVGHLKEKLRLQSCLCLIVLKLTTTAIHWGGLPRILSGVHITCWCSKVAETVFPN